MSAEHARVAFVNHGGTDGSRHLAQIGPHRQIETRRTRQSVVVTKRLIAFFKDLDQIHASKRNNPSLSDQERLRCIDENSWPLPPAD